MLGRFPFPPPRTSRRQSWNHRDARSLYKEIYLGG